MTCSMRSAGRARRNIVRIAALILLASCGGGPTALLRGNYHHDNGCRQGVLAAVGLARELTGAQECVEHGAVDHVHPTFAARAERSLDRDERDHARGYVRCFENAFDTIWPDAAAAEFTRCRAENAGDCWDPETGSIRQDLLEFQATETCPSYASLSPGCPIVNYSGLDSVGPLPYKRGEADGSECLEHDDSFADEGDRTRQQRQCQRTAYAFGWVIGHVECLNRTERWRDGPAAD